MSPRGNKSQMILACKNPSFLNAGNALAMAPGKDGSSVMKAIEYAGIRTPGKKSLENVRFPRNLSNGPEDFLSLINFYCFFNLPFFTSIFNQIQFLKIDLYK